MITFIQLPALATRGQLKQRGAPVQKEMALIVVRASCSDVGSTPWWLVSCLALLLHIELEHVHLNQLPALASVMTMEAQGAPMRKEAAFDAASASRSDVGSTTWLRPSLARPRSASCCANARKSPSRPAVTALPCAEHFRYSIPSAVHYYACANTQMFSTK